MTDLAQAIRDAIEALKTPAPREIIAEQLQRALDAEPSSSQQMTARGPFSRLRTLSDRLQDPASRNTEYAASLLSSVREELKEILEDIRMTIPTPRDPDAREALRELVERIDAIHNDPQFKSVWMVNQLHAGSYRGPTYIEELKKARAALRQPAAPGGEICPVCCGSGYSNHPDSGEICSACEGQGGKPTPSDERAKVIEDGNIPERERWWLIERPGPVYTTTDGSYPAWSTDPWRAKRFATARQADNARLSIQTDQLRNDASVVEHMFINKQPRALSPLTNAAAAEKGR